MKVQDFRYGYAKRRDSELEGDTVTQIHITDEQGIEYFIAASTCMEYMKVEISKEPLFDKIMELADMKNIDEKIHQIERICVESGDFMEEELEEKVFSDTPIFGEEFLPAVRLSLVLLDFYYYNEDFPELDTQLANAFMRKYLTCEDIRKMQIVLPPERFILDSYRIGTDTKNSPMAEIEIESDKGWLYCIGAIQEKDGIRLYVSYESLFEMYSGDSSDRDCGDDHCHQRTALIKGEGGSIDSDNNFFISRFMRPIRLCLSLLRRYASSDAFPQYSEERLHTFMKPYIEAEDINAMAF